MSDTFKGVKWFFNEIHLFDILYMNIPAPYRAENIALG